MPGKKNNRSRKQSDERVSFLQNFFGNWSIYLKDSESLDDDTPDVHMWCPNKYGRDYFFNLTHMTIEELNKFEQFIKLALALSRPIIEERDRVAAEAYDNGDDSFARVYRQESMLVVRPRARRDEEEYPLFNSLVDILQQSPFVLLDQNDHRDFNRNMDFWSEMKDDDLPMPIKED